MMLSAMAMLAMSTYFAKQQAKGWSLKRVFGCSEGEVYWNMSFSFLKVVLLAAVVAIPVGYYIVGEWLSSYSYRIENWWWIYALALLLVLVVSLASISWQALRLGNIDPAKVLKKE